jgi:hypothetical protein
VDLFGQADRSTFMHEMSHLWLDELARDAGHAADVSGARHEVDAYATRHTFKEHGSAAREEPRGQGAVTAEDWAMIPDVLASPDHMEYVGLSRVGRDTIGYRKAVNGHVLYIEEVRTGRHTLSAVSLRKYKRGGKGSPGRPDGPETPSQTSETHFPARKQR